MIQPESYDFFANLRYLMLEANSACNLRCKNCNRAYLEEQGWRSQQIINEEEFTYLLSQFRNCPIDTIKFEGLSEPMMHPRFDVLSRSLRSIFPSAFVIIATNLQYYLEKTAFLQTLPFVDMVYLSIDGTEEVYERMREGAKWDLLLRSLQIIQEQVPEKVRLQKLHINVTLTEENVHTLPGIYQLKERFHLGSVRLNLAQNWNEHEQNAHQFDSRFVDAILPYRPDVKGVAGWEYKECFWPFEGMVVDVFGDVRQCVINTSMKPIANVFRDNIREVFNQSMHYRQTRKLLQCNQPAENCQTCDYHHLSPTLLQILGDKHAGNLPRKFFVPFDAQKEAK